MTGYTCTNQALTVGWRQKSLVISGGEYAVNT
jgi:hypothetical protein